jgi:hypothetical protein
VTVRRRRQTIGRILLDPLRRRAIRGAHAVKTYRRRIRGVAARGNLVPYYPSILLVWLSVINPSAHLPAVIRGDSHKTNVFGN